LAKINVSKLSPSKPFAAQHSDSLIWGLSGSTLVHILLILGLGFYITQQAPRPIKHTVSVDLVSASQLSSLTQLGSGAEPSAIQPPSPKLKRKRIIHTDAKDKPFDKNAFLLEQQRLINEINKQAKVIKKSKRTGFLGVTDTRPAYQQYQKYWQTYVSQFGTKHYPGVLLEKDLAGSLELDITIDTQGVVRATDIHRSSGNTDIDNAAIEIAMLASPYKPLPEEISSQFDALHIIRTWEFKNNALSSRPTTLN
jgi:TonB family protein